MKKESNSKKSKYKPKEEPVVKPSDFPKIEKEEASSTP